MLSARARTLRDRVRRRLAAVLLGQPVGRKAAHRRGLDARGEDLRVRVRLPQREGDADAEHDEADEAADVGRAARARAAVLRGVHAKF